MDLSHRRLIYADLSFAFFILSTLRVLVELCFFDFVELLGCDSYLRDADSLNLGEAVVKACRISKGDDVVVCSDGLHKEISINQLLEFVKNGRHEDLLGSKVIKDNNSFVYIGV